jgi:CheY-like chemotaxis protein
MCPVFPDNQDKKPTGSGATVGETNHQTKPCILIVEDEVLVRMFAVDALEDEGFRVVEGANAAEALSKLEELRGQVAAVIIDLGLPDRPGDQVAAEIRTQHPDLPILIASGRSERELKERFAISGRVGIVVKPFTGPMLYEALEKLGVKSNP